MTIEQKKQYLQTYRALDREVQRKVDDLAHWRAKATQITPVLDGMPKAKTVTSRMEDVVIRIVQLENEVNEDIDHLVALKEEIMQRLEAMPNYTFRMLLQYRYIQCMTWEKMAEAMHYTWQHLHKLHKKALEQF